MNAETAKAKINDILKSKEKIAQWANWNNLAVETARNLLEKLAEQPEVSAEANKYVWEKASSETQAYAAGEEKGYKRGVSAGFAKGIAYGAGSFLLMGVAVVVKAASKGVIDFTKLVPKK